MVVVLRVALTITCDKRLIFCSLLSKSANKNIPGPDGTASYSICLEGGAHKQTSGAMKQLTTVVKRRLRRGDGEKAGGQQQLGQHAGADPLQMFHSQLTDTAEPQI